MTELAGWQTASVTGRRSAPPRDYLQDGGTWPAGPLATDAPAYATKTAEVVQRLEAAMELDGRSARRLSLDADIDPGTLSRLRSGQAIPDLGTLVGLENALGKPLWCAACARNETS